MDMFSADPIFFGQATSDGNDTDVEFHGEAGTTSRTVGGTANQLAFFMVVGALALLWIFGASVFKGSNHS